MENCDGGTLDGMNISQKLTKVLNISSSVLVPRGENHDVDALESNIQDMIKLPRTNAYHTQLVKYEAKSEYKAHTDCHHIPNDRMATIIIYLTDVDEGGETVFPFLNISIKPQRGMAVVWRNLDDDGKCDESTTHVAGQVKKGEKYIYQKWFYQKPILPQYQDD
ncbi:probable prolyl 4-hydroxylase 10, partial [Paramuricea clavata]